MNSYRLVITFFDHLFYRMYLWQLGQWNDKRIAVHAAGTNVGFLLGLNLLTVLNTFAATFGLVALSFFDAPKLVIVVSIIAWSLMFERFYSLRANKLIIEFESLKNSRADGALHYPSWLYCFGTFIIFLTSCLAVALKLPARA